MLYKKIYFFRGYSFLLSEAEFKEKYGEILRVLTPKHMLQRFPIALA